MKILDEDQSDSDGHQISMHFPNLLETVCEDKDIASSLHMIPLGRSQKSEKSKLVALFFCLSLGFLGFHRFYTNRHLSGFIMMVTLGGLGLWVLFDLIFILLNKFTDDSERVLA